MNSEFNSTNPLCQLLNKLIDLELEKERPNMEFINECNVFLDKIEKGEYEPTSKKKRYELKKLYRKCRRTFNNNKRSVTDREHQSNLAFRRAPAIVCICLLLLAIPITVAAVNGISPIEIIAGLGEKIFSWSTDLPVEIDSMTFIRNGQSTHYDTIEDCINQENLEIYYPSWLPEGIAVESIIMLSTIEGEQLIIKFNDETLNISINLYSSKNKINYNNIERYKKIEVNDITAYYEILENRYYVTTELKGYQYYITATDYNTIKNILKGLQKVT